MYQVSSKSDDFSPRYGDLTIFKMAAVRFDLGGGVCLAVRRSLCAPLIEYERGGPLHPAHGGVTFPGILFMTWRAQGDMIT